MSDVAEGFVVGKSKNEEESYAGYLEGIALVTAKNKLDFPTIVSYIILR